MSSRRNNNNRSIEGLGLNWLVSELQHTGIETAYPVNDALVDLIASAPDTNRNIPIQLFAASHRSFNVNHKYSGIADLLLVYVWNLQAEEPEEAYAMKYAEAEEIAPTMRWTKTLSWQRGLYFTSKPSEDLLRLLEPFRMTPAKWLERIRGR